MTLVLDDNHAEASLDSMVNYVSHESENQFSYKNFEFQDLSLQTQKEVKTLIYTLCGQLTREIQQRFSDLKKTIAERPVYVMFEPLLNCNPLTDHQSPKNILPIF